MPEAKHALSNYLTETIREVVRSEVLDPTKSAGKLYGKPRIFNDLLSSQPLCFNLFGEMLRDLPLASKTFARLSNGRISKVTAIQFEHSPGRRDPAFTDDRSAFDVFVEYVPAAGGRGFAGIEVKYHEALGDPAAPHRDRYSEIAQAMAAFNPSRMEDLKAKPLQQIWRDHLLAGSLLAHKASGYTDGFFVFLRPELNAACQSAVASYRKCLADETAFAEWTLEGVRDALRKSGAPGWVERFHSRYLAFDRLGTA